LMVLLQCHFAFGSFWEFNISCSRNTTCSLQIKKSDGQNWGHRRQEVHEAVQTLDIVDSMITHLPNNVPKLFPNLDFLKADKCGLEHIQPELFGRSAEIQSSRLQTLKLADNNIETIESYSFEKCVNLTSIDLANNSISSIESEAFAGLNKLDTLDLNNNKLQVLDETVFADCLMLGLLNLASNQLTATACINNLTNMYELDLSNNENMKLIKSPVENFGPALTSLKLNGIKQSMMSELYEFISQFVNLSSLSIGNNGISEFRVPNLVELKNLEIFGNDLKTINIGNNLWECSQLEVMLIKFRNSGINPITHQKQDKCKGQIDGFDCCTVEEIIKSRETSTMPLYIVAVVIGSLIGVIAVLLLMVYLTLRRMPFITNNYDDNDFWTDDSYATIGGSPKSPVNPYETIANVELNPIYEKTQNNETVDDEEKDSSAEN
jgi:Leucine rich repeat